MPDGFKVFVFSREPMVRNPCAMAFDARGRLFIVQGQQQYRKSRPDTSAETPLKTRLPLLEGNLLWHGCCDTMVP